MTEVPIDDLPINVWSAIEDWLLATSGNPCKEKWYVSLEYDGIGNEHTTLYLRDDIAMLFALRWL